MGFKKFGDKEKVIVLDTEQTNVIQSHKSKVGKTSLQDFTEEERNQLHNDLENLNDSKADLKTD
jgi:C-terminal processing protease CtpA/Prc